MKQLKKLHELRISNETLSRANTALMDEWRSESQKTDQARRMLLQNYINTQKFKNDFLKELQPEIQKGLSFVHDYKQVNAQIKQNINVIIESRYSGSDFEAKLAQCSHAEKAIYEASKFLEEKLAVTKFLMHPEWLDRATECEWSRFHGLVHKYLKIYESRCRAKKVEINLAGETFQNVWANRQALAVIPHTLIDNAVKYSPKGGRIEIIAHNLGKSIRFEVSSYGPQILPDEIEKIFQPFYRGRHAEKAEEEGSGYGLYLSQLIAQRHFGASIAVRQSSTETIGMGFWTTFSIEIPERATIGRPRRDTY